jgi:hypothetical protein
MISKEYLHERFEYREGELYWKIVYSNRLKIGQIAGDKDGRGYRRVMLGKQHHKVHRLIYIMFNGNIPENMIIDHIDQNISNNKIENLRLVNKSQNNLNRGALGVTFDKVRNKWRAQTSIDNQTQFIGRFNTKEEAIKAYQEFTQLRFG